MTTLSLMYGIWSAREGAFRRKRLPRRRWVLIDVDAKIHPARFARRMDVASTDAHPPPPRQSPLRNSWADSYTFMSLLYINYNIHHSLCNQQYLVIWRTHRCIVIYRFTVASVNPIRNGSVLAVWYPARYRVLDGDMPRDNSQTITRIKNVEIGHVVPVRP